MSATVYEVDGSASGVPGQSTKLGFIVHDLPDGTRSVVSYETGIEPK